MNGMVSYSEKMLGLSMSMSMSGVGNLVAWPG